MLHSFGLAFGEILLAFVRVVAPLLQILLVIYGKLRALGLWDPPCPGSLLAMLEGDILVVIRGSSGRGRCGVAFRDYDTKHAFFRNTRRLHPGYSF